MASKNRIVRSSKSSANSWFGMARVIFIPIVSWLCCVILCFAGNAPSKVSLKTIKVGPLEFAIGDRDAQISNLATKTLTHPKTLDQVLEADDSQKIVMKFQITDAKDGSDVLPHQVFTIFKNRDTNQEVVFVVEPEQSTQQEGSTVNVFKFDLNLGARAKDFESTSGLYDVNLVIGDQSISNNILWKLGSVKLSFTSIAKPAPIWFGATWTKVHYGPKPEITHIFRSPEKRPPTVVSDTFSFLVTMIPFFVLAVLWSRIPINLNGFKLSLSGLIFFSSLGAIFSLYFLFWLQLDMFTTLKYLSGLGIIAFLSGHSLLKQKA